jgi:hypothetical protein
VANPITGLEEYIPGLREASAGYHVNNIEMALPLASYEISPTTSNLVLTRNGAMDWSFNRTAGGAETHYVGVTVPFNLPLENRSLRLNKVKMNYNLSVAAATSVDLTVDSIVYDGTGSNVTANFGGTIVNGSYDAANNTAALRLATGEHNMILTMPAPAYFNKANGTVRIEAVFVLPNTSVLKVRSLIPVYEVMLTPNVV